MSETNLQKMVEAFRADYTKETGKPFEHFYCPILRRDDKTELCEGHIVNDALDGSFVVPQRKDVDNFFGSTVEAKFIDGIRNRGKSLADYLLDKNIHRKYKPKLQYDGVPIDYYVTPNPTPVRGQSVVTVTSGGQVLCNVAVKMSQENFNFKDKKLEFVFEHNFASWVVGAMLKAAHLTMFRMLGYRYVLSPAGLFTGDILKQFYDAHNGQHDLKDEQIYSYFYKYENMVAPFHMDDPTIMRGTVADNRALSIWGASEGIFAVGVIIPLGTEAFCVFLPSDFGNTINTYMNFLNESPVSIATRVAQFHRGDAEKGDYWEVQGGEYIRIPLKQPPPEHVKSE